MVTNLKRFDQLSDFLHHGPVGKSWVDPGPGLNLF